MKLTGGALKRLQAITPAGCEAQIDVSLTDEGPAAQAIVIISALPQNAGVKPRTTIQPSAYTTAAAFLIAPWDGSRYKVAGARRLNGGTRGR